MKVYLVYADDWDYDDYDSIVVVAENEDNALAMANSGYFNDSFFKKHQGEIHVKEVDLTTEHIVLTSFNAG
jgi:hypothetical protein